MDTIYIIGDSTVEDGRPPFRGWGWSLGRFVREGVRVENHAIGGRSSKSFWNEGRFEPVAEVIGPGDLLLIQFGHNDEKDDDERHTDPATTYPEQLRKYCDIAREKGAQPVLITSVCRRFFSEPTSLMYTHGEYPAAVRRLAAETGVPLCDLKKDSRALYLRMGREACAELFVRIAPGENPEFPEGHDDFTHFCEKGSAVIAGLVAEELKAWPVCAGFMK